MIPLASWALPPALIAGTVILEACPNPLALIRHLPTPWQLATFDEMPAETHRLWAPARVRDGERPGLRFSICYHPVLQALARPGCTARAVRLPVAFAFQGAVDLAVGT